MPRILASLAVVGVLGVTGVTGVTGAHALGLPDGTSRAAHRTPISLADRSGAPTGAPALRNHGRDLGSRALRMVVTPEQPVRVLLVGDSLAWEAQGSFSLVLTASRRAQVQTMVYGGTAICDWLPRLEAELQAFRPQATVVEFSGNNLTPCMQDPATGTGYAGAALVAKYRADANLAMELFARYGVTAYWANAPLGRGEAHPGPIPGLYAQLPSRWLDARYVDAGAAVLDHGAYTDYLPCLPVDPCTNTNPGTGQPAAAVRAPDGHHFCPTAPAARRGVTDQCPVWASGAWRYGTALAAPIVASYQL